MSSLDQGKPRPCILTCRFYGDGKPVRTRESSSFNGGDGTDLTQMIAVLKVLGSNSLSHLLIGDSERLDRFFQILPKLNAKSKQVQIGVKSF